MVGESLGSTPAERSAVHTLHVYDTLRIADDEHCGVVP